MLSKLIKHEFRATARVMLPSLGALLLMSLLAGLSIRTLDNPRTVTLLRFFAGLFLFLFVVGIIAAWALAIAVMVTRFYRNLLGVEGYLMFTLPTNTHALIWSKLIVSTVWFIVTLAAILLSLFLTGLTLGALHTVDFSSLPELLRQFMPLLREQGVTAGQLWLLFGELVLSSLLSCLVICLQLYAAMSLGQMATNHRLLMSVLAFIGINLVFQLLGSTVFSGLLQTGALDHLVLTVEELAITLPGTLKMMSGGIGLTLLAALVQAAVLYGITAFCLQKKLNLA